MSCVVGLKFLDNSHLIINDELVLSFRGYVLGRIGRSTLSTLQKNGTLGMDCTTPAKSRVDL